MLLPAVPSSACREQMSCFPSSHLCQQASLLLRGFAHPLVSTCVDKEASGKHHIYVYQLGEQVWRPGLRGVFIFHPC